MGYCADSPTRLQLPVDSLSLAVQETRMRRRQALAQRAFNGTFPVAGSRVPLNFAVAPSAVDYQTFAYVVALVSSWFMDRLMRTSGHRC